MLRPLRLEFKDAWYHVMNRGAGYRAIYKSERHRTLFLEVLAEAASVFGLEVQAYYQWGQAWHFDIV